MGKRSEYKNQILATICMNIISLAHGIGLAWTSPAILYLTSPETIFPITDTEIGWLSSLFLIGVILGCTSTGFITNFIGRKFVLWCMGIPHILFWLLVLNAQNIYYLYIGRVFTGITAGGIMVCISSSIIEFASKEIRVNLGCCFSMAMNMGRVTGMATMSYTEYHHNPYIFIGLPILFMVLVPIFPPTPQQLLRQGKDTKAKKSLKFYRNFTKDTDQNELDMQFLELKTRMIEENDIGNKIAWADFRVSAIFQGIIIIFISMSSGSLIIFNVVGSLYQRLNCNPDIGAITYAASQLVAAISAIILSNRFTRKHCLTVTSFLSVFGLLTTAVLSIFVDGSKVMQDLSWIFYISINISAFNLQFVNSLAHVVAAELFPLKTKSISLSIVYACGSVLAFGITTEWPLVMANYGRFGVFFALLICGSICFFGAIFNIFLLTETSKKKI